MKNIKKIVIAIFIITIAATTIFALTACETNSGTNLFDNAQNALQEANIDFAVWTAEDTIDIAGGNVPQGFVRQLFTGMMSPHVAEYLAIMEFSSASYAIAHIGTNPMFFNMPNMEFKRNGSLIYIGMGEPFEIVREIIGGETIVRN